MLQWFRENNIIINPQGDPKVDPVPVLLLLEAAIPGKLLLPLATLTPGRFLPLRSFDDGLSTAPSLDLGVLDGTTLGASAGKFIGRILSSARAISHLETV
ncbi:hypothetical protein BHE90_009271 [Fusarium euwallaceae]|uniref:Uncharacterized protein n=1 Tax=Fusarium euwallaceae TaxID=1147111 RepID=A0A430LKP7_9HYPO|nr:hypothetical protein BHE90_009271 [Fusarium euwallaceae]